MNSSLNWIREEFGGFVRRTGDFISTTEGILIPNYFHHSFSAASELPIPSKEKKWRIGRAPNDSLKILDKYLVYFVKYHRKYDYEGFIFYCYEEDGKIHFETELAFSDGFE